MILHPLGTVMLYHLDPMTLFDLTNLHFFNLSMFCHFDPRGPRVAK
jgi:hypothetical protein